MYYIRSYVNMTFCGCTVWSKNGCGGVWSRLTAYSSMKSFHTLGTKYEKGGGGVLLSTYGITNDVILILSIVYHAKYSVASVPYYRNTDFYCIPGSAWYLTTLGYINKSLINAL